MVKVYIGLALIVIGFGSGWQANGWRLGSFYTALELEHSKAQANALEAQKELTRERTGRIAAIDRATTAERLARETKATTITKEVFKYVYTNNDSDCLLDADWVRLHNLAASTRYSSAALRTNEIGTDF